MLEPVGLTGQRIATSFWGKEWCKNLESYMDFSNRLPRGRTYLRSGAVVDLRIASGRIDALVAGSSLYEVSIKIGKLARRRWGGVIKRCAGHIDSVIGLLQGKLSDQVLEALVDRRGGLFPAPRRSTSPARAPTPRCSASILQRSSTESARGSTRSQSCSSRYAAWLSKN